MSHRPFKFVHAADFHLELPGEGCPDVPDSLAELLIECPYRAAEQVFDTAIADEVDFVLLSGNLLDVDLTGPRGMIFLIEQFERLRQRRIEVYWAAGEVDAAERRSASFRIPDNVRIFSSLRPEEITVSRVGKALCLRNCMLDHIAQACIALLVRACRRRRHRQDHRGQDGCDRRWATFSRERDGSG